MASHTLLLRFGATSGARTAAVAMEVLCAMEHGCPPGLRHLLRCRGAPACA